MSRNENTAGALRYRIVPYRPPRPLSEIETDFKRMEKQIADILVEVTA